VIERESMRFIAAGPDHNAAAPQRCRRAARTAMVNAMVPKFLAIQCSLTITDWNYLLIQQRLT
jgi:hypothetical protein